VTKDEKVTGCTNQCSGKFNAREKFKMWGWFHDPSTGSWGNLNPGIWINYETAKAPCNDWRNGYLPNSTPSKLFQQVCSLIFNDASNKFELYISQLYYINNIGWQSTPDLLAWTSSANLIPAGQDRSSYLEIDEGNSSSGTSFTCRAVICNCTSGSCPCTTPVESSQAVEVITEIKTAGSQCDNGTPADYRLRGGRVCTVNPIIVDGVQCDSGAEVQW
jgi:hypothetical protein